MVEYPEEKYTEMMERFWRMGIHGGLISDDSTPEEFFGFTVQDIEGVHHRLAGISAGTWFRLRDGRVIDSCARPAPPSPALYDVVVN
jgi:hypothetical protein